MYPLEIICILFMILLLLISFVFDLSSCDDHLFDSHQGQILYEFSFILNVVLRYLVVKTKKNHLNTSKDYL